MAILKNRIKTVNIYIRIVELIINLTKRFFIIFLITFCLLLMHFAKNNDKLNVLADCTNNLVAKITPVYDKLFLFFDEISSSLSCLKDLKTENELLKHQLTFLEKINDENQSIKIENRQLKKLLKTVPEHTQSFITARLMTVIDNPFSRSVIVAVGTNQEVRLNQLVTNEQGLIGRITRQTNNYSKVMTIFDSDSHIPVITANTRERGILVGYNSGAKIIYLPKNHSAKVGETIITSGDGDIYPYGIDVAKIITVIDSEVVVEPIVDLSKVEYVKIHN
ncbi:MAG: rod shape-determining protein MreC [Rickettsiaceae bacterium]|nr:MAG: rod shape-determining protein MreC [Rickettsiaceae bacterium]